MFVLHRYTDQQGLYIAVFLCLLMVVVIIFTNDIDGRFIHVELLVLIFERLLLAFMEFDWVRLLFVSLNLV